MIRNIIFDMGHVLLWYDPIKACRSITETETDAQTLYAAFSGPLWVEVDKGTLDETAFTDAVKQLLPGHLHTAVDALYQGLPNNVLSPVDGMADVVDETLNRGFAVYLLSNAGRFMSRKRAIIPHIERFHGVMFSGDEGYIKPDPRLFKRLMSKYNLKPEECLFIDDYEPNTAAAAALGWQTHQFTGDIPALQRVLDAL